MKSRANDPRRLDVEAVAREGATLEGTWPLGVLKRLAACAHPDATPAAQAGVRWQGRGELRAVRGDAPQVWLHLEAQTSLALVCQRCLGPVPTELHARRSYLFVPGEEAAAALDADAEDDVLALTRALDLEELVEDELLLSMPLVPRHDVCPQPLPSAVADPGADATPEHPFAVLAALKRPGQPN